MLYHDRYLRATTGGWTEHATAFDRVRSVAQTLTRPRTAAWVAEEALVSPTTAHDHLDRLVDLNVVREVPGEDAVRYEPDPLHVRLQTLRELLDEYTREELVELKAELQEEIAALQDEFDAESPAELRDRAADAGTADETARLGEAAGEWDLLAYRLSVVEEAIANYAEYTRDHAPA